MHTTSLLSHASPTLMTERLIIYTGREAGMGSQRHSWAVLSAPLLRGAAGVRPLGCIFLFNLPFWNEIPSHLFYTRIQCAVGVVLFVTQSYLQLQQISCYFLLLKCIPNKRVLNL